jgi:spore coat protein CotH
MVLLSVVMAMPVSGKKFGEEYWGERLTQVRIAVAPEKWNELRVITRELPKPSEVVRMCNQSGGIDIRGFADSPFEYTKANVTVNGEERVGVGLKKKGFFGSGGETTRISMKVKLGKYDKMTPTLNGMDQLTLNGARQGKGERMVACVVYDIYRKAGLYAPRCGYAHVFVNDQDFGLYVLVESYTERWLKSEYGFNSKKVGNMYSASASDFAYGFDKTFDQSIGKVDYSPIDAVVKALAGQAPVKDVEPLIDLDYFLSFWALETILGLPDSASSNRNNYNVYRDPTRGGKFIYLPWGPGMETR